MVEPRNSANQQKESGPVVHYGDVRLDFASPVALRKSYIVASSQRCGSTFLCNKLWQTGVLGAPAAYFQNRQRPSTKTLRDTLTERLGAWSSADYLEKLIAVRTSRNGVFGVKAHIHDFEAMLSQNPDILKRLSPVTYIYVDRTDKLAQAVSLAMALQTDVWSSLKRPKRGALRYDKQLISRCLDQNEQQERGWRQWFGEQDITPFHVTYEDLVADADSVVRRVVEMLGVAADEPDQVSIPAIEKQGDGTNMQWIARYRREVTADRAQQQDQTAADGNQDEDELAADDEWQEDDSEEESEHRPEHAAAPPLTKTTQGFDRVDRAIKTTLAGQKAVTGAVDSIRWQFRYEAIINQNRTLFHNARVLDVQGFDGRWSLAALEAGASHVVCLEARRASFDELGAAFTAYSAKRDSYELINSPIFQALKIFDPGQFDVILFKEFSGQIDPRVFFRQLHRLRPRHVILDVALTRGRDPIVLFKLANQAKSARDSLGPRAPIIAIPTHELIAVLCDYFGFQWRQVDWQAFGIADWTGLRDYERGLRRTYVLDWTPNSKIPN